MQLLFITDAQRRRIHSNDHDASKPGRQVVTFLLICNITMWVIYTFEVQKVKDSPVQVKNHIFFKLCTLFLLILYFFFFSAPLLRILCLVNDSKSLLASLHILSISFLGDFGGNLEEFLQDQIDGLKYKLTYLLRKKITYHQYPKNNINKVSYDTKRNFLTTQKIKTDV